MAYLALYRRYRPTTFDGIIGQEHIVKTLVNQISLGRLGHAYLFTGTRGTGKTSTAKIFAKAINCLSPVNGSPCGKCEACKALSDPSNIDVIEIDAASNNGVNEIRELRENVQFPPVTCRYKVYIIDEVHMLTGPAFNALLKTLEEPPKHAVFILATTEVHKIPATILSRCMRFDFRLVATEQIVALISSIFDEQGKKYQPEAVTAIAKAGEGSIRDALSIADTAFSYSDGVLTYDDVMEILGSTNVELLYEYIENVFNQEHGAVLETLDKFASLGKSMGMLIKDATSVLRDIIVVQTCANAKSILALPEQNYLKLKELASLTNPERVLRIMQIFSDAENDVRYTNHPRVIVEMASLKATRPETDYDIDALLGRIKTLEDKISSDDFTINIKEKPAKVQTVVSEEKNEKPSEEIREEVKTPISNLAESELKGKLLAGLRDIKSEMLWNIVQDVDVTAKNNALKLTVSNDTDYAVLQRAENIEKIKNALSEFLVLGVEVALSQGVKQLEKIDDATEKLKKIFGEDIIIVKK